MYGGIEDGKQSRICCRQRILPQNTLVSAGKSAIIEAIQLEKNNRHQKVSTIMAAENRTPKKNPKTQTIRKMLDHERPRITLRELGYQNRDQRWKNGNNDMK
jgi:hypothetical protein